MYVGEWEDDGLQQTPQAPLQLRPLIVITEEGVKARTIHIALLAQCLRLFRRRLPFPSMPQSV